ncbi:RNA polymerase II C-terminal domain phosphatase-like 2 [Nymphaea colorata]|nr:RNA polymerase II C-terminal domain phosphatase-like 2 [Nymphaea colorata]XP_031487992.1 RNA polymerase II C-terminal domain phosphatase-like 2 [Nymphaea colorata]
MLPRGGFKSIVYHGDVRLGEADVLPQNPNFHAPSFAEIRVTGFSPPSERCQPLAVLQAISASGLSFKLEFKSRADFPSMHPLHVSCFNERKTAVVMAGNEEVHLVAMLSRKEKFLCFWAFNVARGLYSACLGLLNLRCLAIVFDLDETLIVANTMKSFEDRIDALQRKLSLENDPQRVAGMSAELKRYVEDKGILKQYTESDQVTDNGKMMKAQSEEVPPLSDKHDRLFRPVIRLPERNMILTRINPEVRDTSVLVRLRPAWDELRSYLTAQKGRKRFEVYVCTMAEKDYALEMWRLLDPEAHLISSKQLLDRVVCVKSGARKSLVNVFQDGICHPKMAMVIDDRLKVWDDRDQPRVHVVPAFAPYYAPQAEMANAVPVLCVARNVACNVRGGFFKEFDENLLRRVCDIRYEDSPSDLPPPPDVSNYLMTEDLSMITISNLPMPETINDTEAEKRINRLDQRLGSEAVMSGQRLIPLGTFGRDEREVVMDPDTRRRLLILQHGHDTRAQKTVDSSISLMPTAELLEADGQSHGGWLVMEDEKISVQLHRQVPGLALEAKSLESGRQQAQAASVSHAMDTSISSEKPQISEVKLGEELVGEDLQQQNNVRSNHSSFSDDDLATSRLYTNNNGSQVLTGISSGQVSSVSVGVLREIGLRCGLQIEFKPASTANKELQFSVEVWFTGEKISEGTGGTKQEAEHQAATNALQHLAEKYVEHISNDNGAVGGEPDGGSLLDVHGPSRVENVVGDEGLPNASTVGQLEPVDDLQRLPSIISTLKELCLTENLMPVINDIPPPSSALNKGEFYAQVEVAGRILGAGKGSTKEHAHLKAAEEAISNLKFSSQQVQKRSNSQRVAQKRPKDESLQGVTGGMSSARFYRNGRAAP